ncbi:MAG: tyrosine-type recombinase/integrase [Flavobacteriaceae bacterium]|nr:MAG: tyrosine-type recombinase/integrase [Flavobacteriaceae bacterium]
MSSNPAEKIEKPKLPKRIPRCLDKGQIESLLLHLDCYSWFNDLEAKRNKAIIRTFLYTGVRLNELLKLKTTSINFEASEIIIYEGKGSKDRIIPIHPDLMLYLKAYQDVKKIPTEYFFSSIRSDKPLTENNLYRIIKKIRSKTKFHFSPHQLRHTFGKLSIEGNLNPFKLQRIMGHSSIETTQIYVYVSDNNLKESFQKINFG